MKVLTRWFFATGPNLFIYLNAWFRENRCRSPDWKTSIEYMQGSRNAIWVMDKNERTRARWSFRWTVQSKRILIKISKKPKEIYTKEKPNMIEVEGIVSVAQCLITIYALISFCPLAIFLDLENMEYHLLLLSYPLLDHSMNLDLPFSRSLIIH